MSSDKKPVCSEQETGVSGRRHDYMSFVDALELISKRRVWIAASVAVFTVTSVFYSLLATPIFRSEVLLAPVDDMSNAAGILGQLDGLAGLAGLNIPQDQRSTEALAILGSREFTRDFIRDENLMPILFANEWDAENGEWRSQDSSEVPDLRDAVELFAKKVRNINEDGATGLVTLSIDWSDAALAAKWANSLANRLNQTLRSQVMERAKYNIEYLSKELSETHVMSLQQAISRLLENEMKTLMLAEGNEEFVFRVIDPAEEPQLRIWPKRALIVAIGMFLGLLLSVVFVFVHERIWRDLLVRSKSGYSDASAA